jgi:hypothetical protein
MDRASPQFQIIAQCFVKRQACETLASSIVCASLLKKYRYACEFFDSLYEGRKLEHRRKEVTAALKRIQSGLGRLNDMQVRSRLAHRFARAKNGGPKQTEKAFAIGLLTGRERSEEAVIFADTVKAARNIADIKPFWH